MSQKSADTSFNLAIFPDNLKDSTSTVALADQVEHVEETLTVMNGSNFWVFASDEKSETRH